jgi:phosphoribosylformylglycinamidine cyclo-ligase
MMDGKISSYAAAGVNIEVAEAFVHRLKKSSGRASHKHLWHGAGGYASVLPMTPELGVALTTDGVGTKLLLACEQDCLETIGIDLVAMCVNDLICVGAKPTGFLDYYATGKLVPAHADALIKGIVEGCDQSDIPLVGGETAEMPDLYHDNHFDLAGFAVGSVGKSTLLTGSKIAPGDAIVAVASSGIHSNGLSLARKIYSSLADRKRLLTPTFIYVKPAVKLFESPDAQISGLANITGGGWRNLLRLNDAVGFEITDPLPVPDVFDGIAASGVAAEEMYKTFNMGMGLAVLTKNAEHAVSVFEEFGFTAQKVGLVTDVAGLVEIHTQVSGKSLVLDIRK